VQGTLNWAVVLNADRSFLPRASVIAHDSNQTLPPISILKSTGRRLAGTRRSHKV
jgi:hypothetical protein